MGIWRKKNQIVKKTALDFFFLKKWFFFHRKSWKTCFSWCFEWCWDLSFSHFFFSKFSILFFWFFCVFLFFLNFASFQRVKDFQRDPTRWKTFTLKNFYLFHPKCLKIHVFSVFKDFPRKIFFGDSPPQFLKEIFFCFGFYFFNVFSHLFSQPKVPICIYDQKYLLFLDIVENTFSQPFPEIFDTFLFFNQM